MEFNKERSKKQYKAMGPGQHRILCKRCGRYLYAKTERQVKGSMIRHKGSLACDLRKKRNREELK